MFLRYGWQGFLKPIPQLKDQLFAKYWMKREKDLDFLILFRVLFCTLACEWLQRNIKIISGEHKLTHKNNTKNKNNAYNLAVERDLRLRNSIFYLLFWLICTKGFLRLEDVTGLTFYFGLWWLRESQLKDRRKCASQKLFASLVVFTLWCTNKCAMLNRTVWTLNACRTSTDFDHCVNVNRQHVTNYLLQ